MTHATRQHVPMLTIGEQVDHETTWVNVASPADALRRVHATRPRAVLVRIDGAGAVYACLRVLEELHRRWPRLALVVLSSLHDDQTERSARAAGAHCYLHGDIDLTQLAEVLSDMDRQAHAPCRGPTTRRPPEARANGPPGRFRA